jgi:DNA adenine methylase
MNVIDPIFGDEALPFLKWAGGKRWLTNDYSRFFPSEFNRYLEPFLGSGAVFFHLRPRQSVLADKNEDLINAFRQIKSNWKGVRKALSRHQLLHTKGYYYEERGRQRRAGHERAAQFIYLNRTCWNGLYRVNLRGEFNVPIGTKNTVLLDSDDFEETARLLRKSKLLVADFEETIDSASENDFVFIDPPYITRHNFNGFIKYNEELFSWSDQERLVRAVRRAAKRGVKVLITNAAHDSIRQLYRGVGRQYDLDRSSVLAADSANRGVTTEIAIVVNFKVPRI